MAFSPWVFLQGPTCLWVRDILQEFAIRLRAPWAKAKECRAAARREARARQAFWGLGHPQPADSHLLRGASYACPPSPLGSSTGPKPARTALLAAS